MTSERLRIGIVGCGDVAHRHYLPGIESRADRVAITALADPTRGAAERLAGAVASWSPGARTYRDVEEMLRSEALDAVFNLTPAPLHGTVNRAILDSGIACFSEKPMASTVAEADALIALADSNDAFFLCAPGSAATALVRWLKELAGSGRLGRPTLAVAHHADPGPAAWREYTGDPTPFYREGVGPVFDHGVYRLHEMTSVLGPVRRVQAMGSIAIPRRRIRGGPLTGQTIDVTTPDHVLIQLEFALRRAGPAAGELRDARHARAVARAAPRTRRRELRREVVGPRRAGERLHRRRVRRGTRGLDARRRGSAGRVRHGGTRRPPLHRVPARRSDPDSHRRARSPRPRRHPAAYASIEDGRAHEPSTTF